MGIGWRIFVLCLFVFYKDRDDSKVDASQGAHASTSTVADDNPQQPILHSLHSCRRVGSPEVCSLPATVPLVRSSSPGCLLLYYSVGQGSSISYKSCQGLWGTSLIPELRSQRQEDLWAPGQPDLQSKTWDSQGYTEESYFKINIEKRERGKVGNNQGWCPTSASGLHMHTYLHVFTQLHKHICTNHTEVNNWWRHHTLACTHAQTHPYTNTYSC